MLGASVLCRGKSTIPIFIHINTCPWSFKAEEPLSTPKFHFGSILRNKNSFLAPGNILANKNVAFLEMQRMEEEVI